MTLGRFNSLEELINSIDMGLDIEFYLYGNRYNISPGEDSFFICQCPDGEATFYNNGTELVNKHVIEKIIKDIWKDIEIYSM